MILVTGVAGFIGFHVARRLLDDGHTVVGIDNLSPYYDVHLKESRLNEILFHPRFHFERLDISDRLTLPDLFQRTPIDRVVHLAAQAGVRYSIEMPQDYIDTNLVGFANILEVCRHHSVEHLVYASSSSVYGQSDKVPFSVHDNVDRPVSLYAATKKANELMAYSYCHLFGLRATGLRFFTVYGPWGRPDMAYFIFTKSILEGLPIRLFNFGQAERDFTYIDDIVEGVVRVLELPPVADSESPCSHRLFNIGNRTPVALMKMVNILEEWTGCHAKTILEPAQPGDVPRTFADISELTQVTGFHPSTPLEDGLKKFVDWYVSYSAELRNPATLRSA